MRGTGAAGCLRFTTIVGGGRWRWSTWSLNLCVVCSCLNGASLSVEFDVTKRQPLPNSEYMRVYPLYF